MIIGVDGNEANVTHKVGVSVYTLNILKYFQANATASQQFIIYLRNKPQASLPEETAYFTYKVVWGPFLWSQFFLPLQLWIDKFQNKILDVFFSPAHYIPRLCPFDTVVTIHDLSYLYFPNEFLQKDLFQLKNWTEYALHKSKKIIAVSKTTKKDIIREYSIPEDKIEVIYNGYENSDSKPYTLNPKPYPYFLYVGTIQPRKNISLLITAFSKFHATHPTYKLILAGKKGWLYEEIFSQVREMGLSENVIFTGYIPNEEKNALYKNATAFILPSLYEGFGIPLLEAMAHECPVLSSFNSSLPEIGGEACLYFDPTNSNDLYKKMELIVSDKNLSKQLISSGKNRIKNFSWNDTGINTLRILNV